MRVSSSCWYTGFVVALILLIGASTSFIALQRLPVRAAGSVQKRNSNLFLSSEECSSSKFLVVTADNRHFCDIPEKKAWELARDLLDRSPGTWTVDENIMKQVYCAMNKAYLRRHNTSFRIVNYDDPHNQLPDLSQMHVAWRKLWVLDQALALVPPGEVVLWLDSDAIFRQHSRSLCDFFTSLTSLDLIGKDALETLNEKSFFFGTTADPLSYHVASHYHDVEDKNNFSAVFGNPAYNTLNSGIFWLRNTNASRTFLKAWKSECEPPSKASCLKDWAWEQHNLVNVLKPFRKHLAVFRGSVFQGPNGQFIRHLWDGIGSGLEYKYLMWTLRENQHLLPTLFSS